MNCKAIKKAKLSGNMDHVLEICLSNLNILKDIYGDEEQIWMKDHDKILDCYNCLCECCFLLRKFDESNKYFEKSLKYIKSIEEEAKTCKTLFDLYCVTGEYEKGLNMGIDILNKIDKNANFQRNIPVNDIFPIYYKKLQEKLSNKSIENLFNVNKIKQNDNNCNSNSLLTLSQYIIINSFISAYYLKDLGLFGILPIYSSLKMLDNGLTSASAACLSYLGSVIQCFNGPSKESIEFCKLGWKLANEFDEPFFLGHSGLAYFPCLYFDPSIEYYDSFQIFEKSKNAALECNSLTTVIYLETQMTWVKMFFCNSIENILKSSYNSLKTISEFKQKNDLASVIGAYHFAYLLTFNEEPIIDSDLSISIDLVPNLFKGSFYLHLLQANYILGCDEFGQIYLDKFTPSLLENLPGTVILYEYSFWASLMFIRLAVSDEQIIDCIEFVKKQIEIYKPFSELNPRNFSHKLALLNAELLKLENASSIKILKQYEYAIKLADDCEFYLIAAISAERLSAFCNEYNLPMAQKLYFQNCYNYFSIIGATAKCQLMESELKSFIGSGSIRSPSEAGASISNATILEHVTKLMTSEGNIRQIIEAISMVKIFFFFFHYIFKKLLLYKSIYVLFSKSMI